MKPTSLCLVNMGVKGLELVSSYPDVLPDAIMNQLIYKSMPMGANPGDFASATLGNMTFSSYIFQIPRSQQRDNIASIVAVFSDSNYDSNSIKQAFSWVITELDNKDMLSTETISAILPKLHKGFTKGKFKIEITSSTTISFDFERKKEENVNKKAVNGLEEDLW